MNRSVLVMSFFGLAILLVFGIFFPTSPVVWLASTSGSFAIVRIVLMAALLALILTHPPRHVYLRVLVGAISFVAAAWALGMTYNNDMKLLDTMALLQVAIAAGISVLEKDPEELDAFVKPRKLHAAKAKIKR